MILSIGTRMNLFGKINVDKVLSWEMKLGHGKKTQGRILLKIVAEALPLRLPYSSLEFVGSCRMDLVPCTSTI